MAVGKEGENEPAGEERRAARVPQDAAQQDQQARGASDTEHERQRKVLKRYHLTEVLRVQEECRVCRQQQRMDEQRALSELAPGLPEHSLMMPLRLLHGTCAQVSADSSYQIGSHGGLRRHRE